MHGATRTKQETGGLLVAHRLPRDIENIPVYWKNFTSGVSFFKSAFLVSICKHKERHQALNKQAHQ